MKYRILVETERSGKKWFYIQKRYMFFLWIRMTVMIGYNAYTYIFFKNLHEAEFFIKSKYDEIEERKKSKIIKREILSWTKN